jgi:hypothetical protein
MGANRSLPLAGLVNLCSESWRRNVSNRSARNLGAGIDERGSRDADADTVMVFRSFDESRPGPKQWYGAWVQGHGLLAHSEV